MTPSVCQRIVIPLIDLDAHGNEYVAGWFARVIGTPIGGEAKYLTAKGLKKSQHLYNLPLAIKSSGPILVCEGTTDVWRVGDNAVALIGKTMSDTQRQLLVRHFRGRPLMIALDQDAQAEAEKAMNELTAARSSAGDTTPVTLAKLPAGRKDIGECEKKEIFQKFFEVAPLSVE